MRLLLIILLLAACIPGRAQEPSYRNISVRQGLPGNEVYDVLQDRQGYIWFATDAGVCRYNGTEIKVFTVADGLSDNVVFGMYEDRLGRIWFRTLNNAISYYQNGAITGIGANDQLRKTKILPPNNGFFIGEGDTLWLGMNDGPVLQIPPANHYSQVIPFQPSVPSDTRIVAVKDPNGSQIIESGTPMPFHSLSLFNARKRTDVVLNERETVNHSKSQKGTTMVRSNGLILFQTGQNMLTIFPDGSVQSKKFPDNLINCYEDKKGGIWVSALVNGLFYFAGGNLDSPPVHLLKDVTVSKVLMDYEGGVWCTTIGKGVYYFPSLGLFRMTRSSEKSSGSLVPKQFILNDDRSLLAGSVGEEFFLLPTRGQNEAPVKSTAGATSLFMGHEIVSRPFITAKKNGRTTQITYANPNTGKKARMYNNGSLSHWRKKHLLYYGVSTIFVINADLSVNQFMAPQRINSLYVSTRDELFVGGNNGLYRYSDTGFLKESDQQELLSCRIDNITEDREGRIWLASRQKGILVWDRERVFELNSLNGLPSNAARQVVVDAYNTVWAATNKGLCKIRFNGGKFTVQAINTSHGLESNEVNCVAYKDGIIYAGTTEGIQFMDTGLVITNTVPPRVAIVRVMANDRDVDSAGLLQLKAGENNIQVYFDNLSFLSEDLRGFRYKLEGFHEDWKFTRLGSRVYTNLPPGQYTFLVQAINRDGVMSPAPARISIVIATPFWRTWWFIVSMVLLILGLAWLLLRWRLKQLRQKEEEKRDLERVIAEYRMTALRSQMNPHFIFNVITSIQHFVLENNSMASYDYLSRFGRLIRLVLENSKAKTIPLAREIETLRLYMELEQLRMNKKFVFEISIGDEVDPEMWMVPTMLVQPYVENAIKHGLAPLREGGWLHVQFSEVGDMLEAVVEDNGVGRVVTEAAREKKLHRSMGLDITGNRLVVLSQWHGKQFEVRVVDKYDDKQQAAGTRVIIGIPIIQ